MVNGIDENKGEVFMKFNGSYICRKTVLLIFSIILFMPGIIEAKDIIRIGVPRALPPYAFIDPNSGDLRGFCVDLAILLAADMGVKSQFYGLSRPRLESALSENRVDLIIGFTLPSIESGDLSIIKTGLNVEAKIFVNKSCVTVTCAKDLKGQIVALERGRDLKAFIQDPDGVEFLEAENQREALEFVNSNLAKAYVSSASLSDSINSSSNRLRPVISLEKQHAIRAPSSIPLIVVAIISTGIRLPSLASKMNS